jgi:uncharacterized LabA/DUF88 family protein
MPARKKSTIKIGIYYDGHYFYKVSNYYKFDHQRQARISIPGLHEFIRNEVAIRLNADIADCNITEAHYFRGRSVKNGNEKAIVGERYFEDALTREAVNLHYLPLVRGSNNDLKEKGIDVSLALDAYKKAASRAIDVLALIAGDGDYLPLVRELQAMNGGPVDVLLLSWDFECANGDKTIASQDLLEEVKYPVQMANVIDDRLNFKNPFILSMFETRQPEPAPTANVSPAAIPPANYESAAPGIPPGAANFSPQVYAPSAFAPSRRKALTETEMARERISTILSLDASGGWIRDVEYNNFYVFYADVINKKPDELAVGTTLQFCLRYDRIKTEQKDNGEPSYRAVGPIYVVD